MSVSAPGEAWKLAVEQVRLAVPELAWLGVHRDRALTSVMSRGLPTPREESWRYTDLRDFQTRGISGGEQSPAPAGGPVAAPPGPRDEELLPAGTAPRILLHDGVLQPLDTPLPAGLVVQSLRKAGATEAARVSERFATGSAGDRPVLVDLNTALLKDAVLIRVAAAQADEIRLHVTLQAGGQREISHPRLLVDLEAHSRLMLVIEYAGGEDSLTNAVSQVSLAPGARLHLVRLQDLPVGALLTDTMEIAASEGAAVEVLTVELGGGLARLDLQLSLDGPDASADVHGIFLADGRRHLDSHYCMDHRAPRTVSHQSVHGIATDDGRGVFNGQILVREGAAGTNASLTNRNLLLSATAEIDTKPELEIYVDDVRCSHGAATGQLDASALFYLRSRGLDADTARELLIGAFFREELESLPPSELRSALEDRLAARLRPGSAPERITGQ